MLIGGMPQAVNEYIDTNNLAMVDAVKRRIIQLYADDFLKIDASGRLGKLFMGIPSQLCKSASRYYASSIVGKMTDGTEEELLINLEDSKAVLVSYHSDDPGVGMSLTKDASRYKLFVADTGLFVTMMFWDKDYAENVIDEKHFYEVDFLLSRGNKICPIEVKSSGYRKHASLDAFRAKYSARIKNSYLLYTKDLQIGDDELTYLPFYMTGMI